MQPVKPCRYRLIEKLSTLVLRKQTDLRGGNIIILM